MVVSNGFDRIRRPYSIIGEFGTNISVGIKYSFRVIDGIVTLENVSDTFGFREEVETSDGKSEAEK